MALYIDYTGRPSKPKPEDVTYLGEVTTHYQSGTETKMVYADTPVSPEDQAEYNNMLGIAKGQNNKDIPIWV